MSPRHATIAAGFALLSLAACASIADLDVTYVSSASRTSTADSGQDEASAEVRAPLGDASARPISGDGGELEACPCDTSQGLGCCVSGGSTPFCTANQERCVAEHGAFYRCFGPDPSSESVCCWHGSGEGASTTLGADCSTVEAVACMANEHCPIGAECKLTSCRGVTIGACGQSPVCPP